MKKYIKLLAILALVGIFTACFAGCKPYIEKDDNPYDFVVLSKDNETLDYQGCTYYKIPKDAELFYTQKTNNIIDKYINVSKEGTPQVISNIFNATAFYDKTHDSFKVEFWNISKLFLDTHTYQPPTEYYCNESIYNAYKEYTESKASLDRIGFEYVYSPESSQAYSFEIGVISEKASKEILGHIENPSEMNAELYETLRTKTVNTVLYAMYKCDSTGILTQRLDDYDIYKTYSTEAYLINKTLGSAVKLSEETAEEIHQKYLHTTYFHEDP